MRRSIHTTAVAAVTAVALSAAPAALARPAIDPAGVQAPIVNHFGPRPVAAPVSDTGGGSDVPWALIIVPAGLLAATGAARKASHRTVLPHRAPRVTI
jgi:hypothetical protein